MRVCHCVGHLTNPGGVCCRDLLNRQNYTINVPYAPFNPDFLDSKPKEIEMFTLPQFTDEEVEKLRILLQRSEENSCCEDTEEVRRLTSFECYLVDGVWYLNLDFSNSVYNQYDLQFDQLEDVLNELFETANNGF